MNHAMFSLSRVMLSAHFPFEPKTKQVFLHPNQDRFLNTKRNKSVKAAEYHIIDTHRYSTKTD